MNVYYLSPSQFAISNLAFKRLKIARFSDLNDPFELMAVAVRDEHELRAFQGHKEELNKKNGLLCFSRSWSNPVLWGHYAEKHTGIALGFEGKDALFEPVVYAKKPIKMSVNSASGKLSPQLADMRKLLCTKFHDWRYENEVRVFVELDHNTSESGLYFYPFDAELTLREVILGPRCKLPITNIRSLVESFDPPVIVRKSSLDTGTLRVVENKG